MVAARMSDNLLRTNNEVRHLCVAAKQRFVAAVCEISECDDAVDDEGDGQTSSRAASFSTTPGTSLSERRRSRDA